MIDEYDDTESESKPDAIARIQELMGSANIALDMDADELARIGQRVVDEYENDLNSMESWLVGYRKGLELSKLTIGEKNTPWPGAANVKFPLIANAAMKFAARAYPEIVRNGEVVSFRTVGKDEQDEKHQRGKRVAQYMNWQLMTQMQDWDTDMDRMLTMLPVVGQMFKKTYFDPLLQQNVSELVLGDKLVVNQQAKSWDKARRKTHTFEMYENDIIERQRMEIYRDCDLRDESNEEAPDDSIFEILEQHRFLDLDDDGYEEPYIVTVEKSSSKVLRIVPRYTDESVQVDQDKNRVVRITPDEYFTPYGFLPSFDGSLHCVGYGHLLYPLNECINTLINQLMDAGTLANMQGGFIGRGLRLRGGPMRFQPGEWKPVDAAGEELQRNIVPIPTKEASPTLFNMLGMLIESANDLASVKDVMSGDMPANTPATTVLAMIEQGQKSFNAIYKRIWRSLTEELRKLFKLNGIYLDPQEYLNIIDEPEADPQSDFEMDGRDIIPVADPAVSSNAQRMAQSQAAMSVSGRPGVNEALLTNDYLKSIGHTKADMIAPYDPQEQEQAKAQAMQQAQQQQEMQQSVIQAQAQKELFDSHMKEREMALKESELGLKREKQESDDELNEAKIQQIVISTIQQVLQVAPGLLIPGAQMIQPAVESAEETEDEQPDQPEFDYGTMGGMETPPGNGIGDGAIDGVPEQGTGVPEGQGAFRFPESAYDASGISPENIEQVGIPPGIDGAD